MAERSTIADKLLETLARQRSEGLLSDEEYASRVEQIVRVPASAVTDPVPEAEAAPRTDVGGGPAPVNGQSGGSALDEPVPNPPQIELDPQVQARAAEPTAPVESPVIQDAATGRSDTQDRRIETAEAKVAHLAVVTDPVRAAEASEVIGDAAAEGQNAQAPQSRRRRFGRKAKGPAAAELQVPAPPPAGLPALPGMSEERLAELKDKLRELEMEGWQAVTEYRACGFYSNRLTDDGLLVLPDGSVLDKWEAAVSALNGDDTWTSYRIEDERMVLLSAGCAALTYTASAQMLDEPEYRAVITSVFVRRGDDWLIALRQETPVHSLETPSQEL